MNKVTKRFLLVSLSLFILGIMYTGCEESAVKSVTNITSKNGTSKDGQSKTFRPTEYSKTIIYVKASANDNGLGKGWDSAFKDLQKGIEKAYGIATNENKIVRVYVAAGIYKPISHPSGGDDKRKKHFLLRNGVEVIGGYPKDGGDSSTKLTESTNKEDRTILSGDIGNEGDDSENVYNVFYHSVAFRMSELEEHDIKLDKTAKLANVIITKGNANGITINSVGGGMFNWESFPTLTKCIFTGNKAIEKGGAVYSEKGDCNPKFKGTAQGSLTPTGVNNPNGKNNGKFKETS